jgi:hypothetical protein
MPFNILVISKIINSSPKKKNILEDHIRGHQSVIPLSIQLSEQPMMEFVDTDIEARGKIAANDKYFQLILYENADLNTINNLNDYVLGRNQSGYVRNFNLDEKSENYFARVVFKILPTAIDNYLTTSLPNSIQQQPVSARTDSLSSSSRHSPALTGTPTALLPPPLVLGNTTQLSEGKFFLQKTPTTSLKKFPTPSVGKPNTPRSIPLGTPHPSGASAYDHRLTYNRWAQSSVAPTSLQPLQPISATPQPQIQQQQPPQPAPVVAAAQPQPALAAAKAEASCCSCMTPIKDFFARLCR